MTGGSTGAEACICHSLPPHILPEQKVESGQEVRLSQNKSQGPPRSNPFPPLSLHFINTLPKLSVTQWDPGTQTLEPMGDISYSNHSIVLNEISQSWREKYSVIPLTRSPAGIKFIERKQGKIGGCWGLGRKEK